MSKNVTTILENYVSNIYANGYTKSGSFLKYYNHGLVGNIRVPEDVINDKRATLKSTTKAIEVKKFIKAIKDGSEKELIYNKISLALTDVNKRLCDDLEVIEDAFEDAIHELIDKYDDEVVKILEKNSQV